MSLNIQLNTEDHSQKTQVQSLSSRDLLALPHLAGDFRGPGWSGRLDEGPQLSVGELVHLHDLLQVLHVALVVLQEVRDPHVLGDRQAFQAIHVFERDLEKGDSLKPMIYI